MNKFLNEKLMPVAAKIGSNKGMIAIRDGITLAMPLIIIGSLLMIIATGFAIPSLQGLQHTSGKGLTVVSG